MLHVTAPGPCAQPRLLLAGNRPCEQLCRQGNIHIFVQGFCQFMRLIVASVPQVVGVLGHGGYHVWPGQAGHGFKHKPTQQRGEVQVPIKLEAQQNVPQGVLIKTVKGHGAPGRGILQAGTAHHVALVGVGGRQPAAGAARPVVGGEQGGATGAERGVSESVCEKKGARVRGVLSALCWQWRQHGRKGAQAVHATVLRQPQPVLPAGQASGQGGWQARNDARCQRGTQVSLACGSQGLGRGLQAVWVRPLHYQGAALMPEPAAARK